MKNRMTDLRNHLFETLERLKDEENPMDLARAKAVSEVAQTLINSAKVEVEFLNITGAESDATGFFDAPRLSSGDPKQVQILTPIAGARRA